MKFDEFNQGKQLNIFFDDGSSVWTFKDAIITTFRISVNERIEQIEGLFPNKSKQDFYDIDQQSYQGNFSIISKDFNQTLEKRVVLKQLESYVNLEEEVK